MKDRKVSKATKMFRRFARGRGLYIALFVLVAMIGIGIYASQIRSDVRQNIASFDEGAWTEAIEESGIEVIDIDEATKEATVDTEPEGEHEATETEKPSDEVCEENAVQTSADPAPVFALERPCTGAVLNECAVDRLVYCEAMDDWRTHNGIDVSAAVGDPVKAAEAGIVSRVYKDQLLGVVVEVDHQNGTSTVYANLQNENFIQAGTVVQKGDVIGGVGNPGALEAGMSPHLHFEIKVDGKYQNPKEIIAF